MMKLLPPYILLLLTLAVPAASAEGLDWKSIYYGGGFGSTSLPDDATNNTEDSASTTLQLFFGYPLAVKSEFLDAKKYRYSLELGYVDVSDSESDGFWLTPVITRYINSEIDMHVRLGVESGDDSGLHGAIGVAYKLEPGLATRLELVERPAAPAIFINVVYRPGVF